MLVGQSRAFRSALADAARAAATAYPVVICGETGTGKELLARYIHDRSAMRSGPFVALNCSAIPENMIEAELFGVEGGVPGMMFKAPAPGKFLLAHGGTLFLDEIGDLALAAQAKLLRAVESQTFFSVCGRREHSVRVRLICAGQHALARLVELGRMRADFRFRIGTLELTLPPLSQRREDIAILAEHFRQRYCPQRSWSDEARAYLQHRAYPGNVRELEMLIKRAAVWCDGDAILPGHFRDDTPAPAIECESDAVLRLFDQQAQVHPRDIRRLLGLLPTRIRQTLDQLLHDGKLRRIGKGRSTAYERA